MKRAIILIYTILTATLFHVRCESMILNNIAGELSNNLSDKEIVKLISLNIDGSINYEDIKFIRDNLYCLEEIGRASCRERGCQYV